MYSYYPTTHTNDLDTTLAYPHYSDERWREAHLIFGAKQKTNNSAYSDRLWEWNYEAAQRASETCKAQGLKPNTARWAEAWLSAYHNKPVALRYIYAQVNWSNGYPVYFYGYDVEGD